MAVFIAPPGPATLGRAGGSWTMRALRGSSGQFSAWLISSWGEGERLGRALLSAPGVLAARGWQRGWCERAHGDLAWH
jgi:hypothetical protein